MERHVYKPLEVAKIMDVSDVHIRNLCQKGEIPHARVGREYRIPVKFVEDWKNGIQTQAI